MSGQAERRAIYQDVLDAPEHLVAEVIDGVLHTERPLPLRSGLAVSRLGGLVDAGVRGASGGAQPWVVTFKPELHLGPEPDVVVPDLGGWRRERYPDEPEAVFTAVAPDWVCEILSPSTARKDRVLKLPLYAREGVRHAWLIDPDTRVLEVYALDGEGWRLLGSYAADAVVSPPPFEDIEISLAVLWNA